MTRLLVSQDDASGLVVDMLSNQVGSIAVGDRVQVRVRHDTGPVMIG
jgi:hypothetical protein